MNSSVKYWAWLAFFTELFGCFYLLMSITDNLSEHIADSWSRMDLKPAVEVQYLLMLNNSEVFNFVIALCLSVVISLRCNIGLILKYGLLLVLLIVLPLLYLVDMAIYQSLAFNGYRSFDSVPAVWLHAIYATPFFLFTLHAAVMAWRGSRKRGTESKFDNGNNRPKT